MYSVICQLLFLFSEKLLIFHVFRNNYFRQLNYITTEESICQHFFTVFYKYVSKNPRKAGTGATHALFQCFFILSFSYGLLFLSYQNATSINNAPTFLFLFPHFPFFINKLVYFPCLFHAWKQSLKIFVYIKWLSFIYKQ